MNKKTKDVVVAQLIKRDGYKCMFPGCILPFSIEDPPTIDHWNPLSIFGDESIENLRLMHFKCNNKKGNIVPNEDGTLSLVVRRPKSKQRRPMVCNLCLSGRILMKGETCPLCRSGPQPPIFHTSMKKPPVNCPHSGDYWCRHCCIGIIPRKDILHARTRIF